MALAWFQEGGRAKLWFGQDVGEYRRERRVVTRRRLGFGGFGLRGRVDNARWRWRARWGGLRRSSELRRVFEELLEGPLAVPVDDLDFLFVDHVVFASAFEVIVAVVAHDGDLAVLAELPTSPLAGDAVGPVSPVGVVPTRRIVR